MSKNGLIRRILLPTIILGSINSCASHDNSAIDLAKIDKESKQPCGKVYTGGKGHYRKHSDTDKKHNSNVIYKRRKKNKYAKIARRKNRK